MTAKSPANAVRAKLLERARRDGEDYNRLLVRYAIERLLYRLSVSPYADTFVLKGATLFALWMGKPHRATGWEAGAQRAGLRSAEDGQPWVQSVVAWMR